MAKWVLVGIIWLASVHSSVTVEGVRFEPDAVVEGRKLQLIGAGLREKWFVDVYALGAYTETGGCDPRQLVESDEAKYLRIQTLRDVPADKMATTIGGAFQEHMPENAPPQLQEQRRRFESYFKEDLTRGTLLELIYIPGAGTLVKQNGKQLGPPLEGAPFEHVLWDIYFGPDSCCTDLRDDILEMCRKG